MRGLRKESFSLIGMFCLIGLFICAVLSITPLVFMLLWNRVAPVYGIEIVLGFWDAFFSVWLITVIGMISKGFTFKTSAKE